MDNIEPNPTPLPTNLKQLSQREIFAIRDDLFYDLALEAQETFNRQHIGHVYVLGSSTGYYKIGQTQNLYRRLKKFEVALPFKVWLEMAIPFFDCIWAEKFFHAHFFEKRLNGEWFSLTYEDLIFIQNQAEYKEDGKFEFIYELAEQCPWTPEFISEKLGKYHPTPNVRWDLVTRFDHEMKEKVNTQTGFEEQFYIRGMQDFIQNNPLPPYPAESEG
jgi:hypothetical protein